MPARPSHATLEGHVRDIAHGGDAVIETEAGIVMARGALPGERVRVRLGKRSSGVLHGEVLGVVEASPDRIAPPCPIVERCGGCPLMTLEPAAQARFKQARLARALAQVTDLVPELIESPDVLAYRTRARLFWQRTGRDRGVGYRAAGSDTLVDVEHCAVLAPELARGYAALRAELGGVLRGRGEVILGMGAGQRCVIELVAQEPQPPEVYAAASQLSVNPAIAGIALRVGSAREGAAAARFGDPRQYAPGLDGIPLWAPSGSFSQANRGINAMLATWVRALAEPEGARVLELYAGYGNLSVGLARGARELRAVESDRDAGGACRENLAARGFSHARVTCADAAEGAQGRSPLDVVVLDPPRAGAKDVLPTLVARRPERIVYVSCDAASLRRDLALLVAAGYKVDAALALDMFPQTGHLESVVRLRRTTQR